MKNRTGSPCWSADVRADLDSLLLAVVLIGAAVLGVIKGGHTDEVLGALSDTRNAAANSVGFRITRCRDHRPQTAHAG